MSFLQQVTSGASKAGQRIVLCGVEKIGKTTLACNAPKTLLVPIGNEVGYASILVPRTPQMTSFEDIMSLNEELEAAAKAGRISLGSTIVYDSTTALERLIHDYVLRSDKSYGKKNATALTMESALGGYGKAYSYANEQFVNFLNTLDRLSLYGGINIVLTCHVFASKIIDPLHGEYYTWDLLLHSPKDNKNHGKREIITQWADMIAYLHEPIFVTKATQGEKMAQVINANQGRVLGVDRTAQYVAGNRYGIAGVIPIPQQNGWNYLADAIFKASGIDLYNREV